MACRWHVILECLSLEVKKYPNIVHHKSALTHVTQNVKDQLSLHNVYLTLNEKQGNLYFQ